MQWFRSRWNKKNTKESYHFINNIVIYKMRHTCLLRLAMGDGDCEPPLSESGGYFVKDILVLGDGHLIASDPVLAPGIRLLLEQSRSESLGATVLRWSLKMDASLIFSTSTAQTSRLQLIKLEDT